MIQLKNQLRYRDLVIYYLNQLFHKITKHDKTKPNYEIKKPITVVSLFGGLASEIKTLKDLNLPFYMVDYVEIEKAAVTAVNALYGVNFDLFDIKSLENKMCGKTLFETHKSVKKHNTLGADLDLIVAGFPCENISSQGNQNGMDKDSGTKSSLVYYSEPYIKAYQPRFMLFECPYGKATKFYIKGQQLSLKPWLENFGYNVYLEKHQCTDFGNSHSRERLYFVCIRKDLHIKYTPIQAPNTKGLPISYYLDDDISEYEHNVVLTKKEKTKLLNKDSFMGSIVSIDSNVYPAILHNYNKCSGSSGKIPHNDTYRILTPHELFKMFGYTEQEYSIIHTILKTAFPNKYCKLMYELIGNSIVSNMLTGIFIQLFADYVDCDYTVMDVTTDFWDSSHKSVQLEYVSETTHCRKVNKRLF